MDRRVLARASRCTIDVIDLDDDLQADSARAGEPRRSEVVARGQVAVVLDADPHGARTKRNVPVRGPVMRWR